MQLTYLTNVCILSKINNFKQWQMSEFPLNNSFSLITCFLLLMHGVADGFVGKLQKSFIRNNRVTVKKISSESDAVIKRARSGSRAIGSRPLH